MKKIIFLLMIIFLAVTFSDCTRSSKKCRQNAKKVTKLRKSGTLKM